MPTPGEVDTAEVHIWFTQLDRVDPARMELYQGWLTAAERSQFANFQSERRRREFIVGRGQARQALAHELSIAPERFEFAIGPQGKLSVAHPSAATDIHFNISHTADYLVCATCRDFAVGLDIERIATRVDPLLIAKRFFDATEAQALEALGEPERLERFFGIWTLKEALAKAHGLGLLAPADASRFEFADDGTFEAVSDDAAFAPGAWLALSFPSPRHRLAVCVICDASVRVRILAHACPTEPGDCTAGLMWSETRLRKSNSNLTDAV